MLLKTEGIVIRSKDYGEANKIITLYTKNYGKLSLMARGAKKPKSRLSSISQLFTYGHYLFFRGSPRTMGTLSQGERLDSFRGLRQDLAKTAYAAYVAELVDKLIDEEEQPHSLFSLLLTILKFLDEGKDPEILARLFELKILVMAGFKPEVDRCVVCHSVKGPFAFSVKEGGFLCQRCHHADPQALRPKDNTLKLMRFLYHFDPSRLGEINVKPETKAELRHVMWLFMDHHTPLRLKSRHFLEQMGQFWN
ncbi:DNA repair protein recO [Caldalkalibacillus thermarum TA2.A1]|uniref:DNA repair protein RecO n=1 Tax=Caldalkalibacillus thermarum (strain TA2.A1) TaxID=986075 RepID=F5L7K5_CALTT|nr:DNA repair protein RecO [Caldalkalibacillus thermarum]EGL82649.1 DNA repair protein recO [Caldalkalibacillus thermarum TA2.A1]QZT33367.1 DNA repair protein RecO [Caldalkalibacillus thermarum TA2.A1]